MTRVIVLDSSTLGLLTNPKARPDTQRCVTWLRALLDGDDIVVIPEIVDYELRRELLRANKTTGLQRLDQLESQVYYAPLTTPVVRMAAALWARARQQGHVTAPPEALDGDVLVAAQALAVASLGDTVIVATSNVRHFRFFIDADLWQAIIPLPA